MLRLFIPAFLFVSAGTWLSYMSVAEGKMDFSGHYVNIPELAKYQFLGSWCVYAGLALLIAMGIVYIVDRIRPTESK